jgi:hypothetical protein
VGKSRKPDAWTPLSHGELDDYRRKLIRKPTAELLEDLCGVLDACRCSRGIDDLPKPFLVQELVQIWRELYLRKPKGRD